MTDLPTDIEKVPTPPPPKYVPQRTTGSHEVRWRVLIETTRSLSWLFLLTVNEDDTGETIMLKLRAIYDEHSVSGWWRRLGRELLCQGLVIKTAGLSSYILSDPEEPTHLPRRVLVHSTTHLPDLTAALHDPSLLRDTPDFVSAHAHFAVSPAPFPLSLTTDDNTNTLPFTHPHQHNHHHYNYRPALLLGFQTSWCRAALLFTFLSLLTIALGVIVGILSHSANNGIAVGAGGAGFVACFEAFVFWVVCYL